MISEDDKMSFIKEIDKMKGKRDCKILVLNCGAGELLEVLEKEGVSNIWGIEDSPEDAHIAKMKKLNVIQGVLIKTPYEDDNFDLVLGHRILGNNKRDINLINESLRIARKSCFISDVYTRKELSKMFRKVPNERHRVDGNLIIFYRKKKKWR